jgi:hypothetical protein
MVLLHNLIFALLPILLACVTILTIALYHRRKHPSFTQVFNFKRSLWLALFGSVGTIALSYTGLALTPALFRFFHIPYEKLGFQDVTCIAFIMLIIIGAFCCILAAICCLWHLIAAIVSYVRAKQNKK